jgi:TetR/AcrR family transcriptional regulator
MDTPTRHLHNNYAEQQSRPQESVGAARRNSTAAIRLAAERVFARRGFHGARMAEIAAEAGLPKANLHYYCGTKEQLYRVVLESILTQWLDTAAEWIVPERHPAEALSGYIRAKMAHARQYPEASRIFAGELLRGAPLIMPFLAGALRQRVAEMSAVIAGWSARGWMETVPPTHLFFTIWAMTQTYADFDVQIRAVLGTQKIDEDAFAAATTMVTAMVLRGCGIPAVA